MGHYQVPSIPSIIILQSSRHLARDRLADFCHPSAWRRPCRLPRPSPTDRARDADGSGRVGRPGVRLLSWPDCRCPLLERHLLFHFFLGQPGR